MRIILISLALFFNCNLIQCQESIDSNLLTDVIVEDENKNYRFVGNDNSIRIIGGKINIIGSAYDMTSNPVSYTHLTLPTKA